MAETIRCGVFEITIEEGGAMWTSIRKDGNVVMRIRAFDLPHLEYAVSRARIEARAYAQRVAPKEVQKL